MILGHVERIKDDDRQVGGKESRAYLLRRNMPFLVGQEVWPDGKSDGSNQQRLATRAVQGLCPTPSHYLSGRSSGAPMIGTLILLILNDAHS
jgi:hypothetical protein